MAGSPSAAANVPGGPAAAPVAGSGAQMSPVVATDPVSGVPAVPEGPPPPDPHNWYAFGGTNEQTYGRVDAMIDSSNLSELGMAWEGTAPGGVTGTPAVYDGVVYWADWVGNVHADKMTDGTEVWTKKFARGFTSSPYVDVDRVYLSDRDNLVYALDRATGEELWKTPISDNPLAQLWSSPMVADGVVVVGLGGKGTSNGGVLISASELMTFRGGVVGLDAVTGAIIWKFENTIGPDGMMYGPGVSSWSSAALDTKRKIAYIGTGNSYYSPASPYSDSLLALDYSTTDPKGKLVWSQQFTMNDNFTSGSPQGPDSDVGATPNLFTLDGKDYVAVGDKGGGFYVMERDTGNYLFPRVRVSTGSSTGGVMAPAAYADGKLYITTNNTGATLVLQMDAKTGTIDWMTSASGGVTYGAPLLINDVLLIGPTAGFPSGAARAGQILAVNRATGALLDWRLPIKNQRGGGLSVYQNTLFISYGFVFENDAAERNLTGGVLAAALGGKVIEPGPAAPVATFAPTYTAIYNEILVEKGCNADRCHGGLGLQLMDQASGYTNLLNGTPSDPNCASMKFIVPGNVDQSYLYNKLQPTPACGGQMPLSLMPLTAEEMTQVRTWIEMGAPNN
jgi:polyvinyl alcohol dehydrogenase (cytochrome)